MRFLIVTPLIPPEPGGPSYYSVALQESLQNLGHTADLLAFKDVRHLPSGVRHLVFFFKVLRLARGMDALFILDTVSVALPAVLAGWILGKKTVIRTGGDFVWEQYVERTGDKVLLSEFYTQPHKLSMKERILIGLQRDVIFRFVSAVVFNTDWQRGIWEKPYGIPKTKTVVIKNEFHRRDPAAHIGGEVFLCAWRPTAFKNVPTLEAAYKLAQDKNARVRLEVFQSIPRDELYERMKHVRALIIPSLSELMPNMAADALSFGLPVLLTHDCGAKECFDGAVTWIDPKSPEDIADKMCALMNEEQYKEEKKKAQSFACEHSYEDIAREFVGVYKKLI
jgi:glycosyltransferase involved in cell wall biosynthesis